MISSRTISRRTLHRTVLPSGFIKVALLGQEGPRTACCHTSTKPASAAYTTIPAVGFFPTRLFSTLLPQGFRICGSRILIASTGTLGTWPLIRNME